MEDYNIQLEEFINLAWNRTLGCFGEDACYKEKEFKKYFKEELQEEFHNHLEYHTLALQGYFDDADDSFTSKEQKESFIETYKNLDYITLAFGSGGRVTTTNLANALMRAGLSDDGNIPEEVNSSYGTFESLELPKGFAFDAEYQKIR